MIWSSVSGYSERLSDEEISYLVTSVVALLRILAACFFRTRGHTAVNQKYIVGVAEEGPQILEIVRTAEGYKVSFRCYLRGRTHAFPRALHRDACDLAQSLPMLRIGMPAEHVQGGQPPVAAPVAPVELLVRPGEKVDQVLAVD